MTVLKNTQDETVLHFTANATVVIAGNTSVSNVAWTSANGETQNVASASIRKIAMASDGSGIWTVKRGANVVWVGAGNYLWDLQAHAMPLTQDATANLVVTLSTGNGSIIIDLGKESAY